MEQIIRTPTQSSLKHNSSSDATKLALTLTDHAVCPAGWSVCTPAAGEGHIVNY